MHDVFHRFAERLAATADAADLHEVLAEMALALDLPLFGYLFPACHDRATNVISTYPKRWTSHYIRSGYDVLDPVIGQARLQRETFRWGADGNDALISAPQRQLMDEASQFGISCGFTIPVHDRRGQFATLTFATDEKRPLFFRVIERYQLALQMVAILFHIQARRTLLTTTRVDGVSLSPRELQCLNWAARGKSAWDIGHILGIAPRTVAFHLDNAKKKLGVRTITQAAIRLALSKGSDFAD